jgi:uncharacterized membrane protein
MDEIKLSSAVPTPTRVRKNTDTWGRQTKTLPRRNAVAEPGLNNNLVAFGTMLILMVVLDLIWLRIIARPWYAQGLAHLMADSPNLPVAALFYAVYALGLLIFAVAPPGLRRNPQGLARAAKSGALFGLFAYATYDLTNLSTLKDWPPMLSIIDIAWGTALSAVCAAVGKRAWDRYATTWPPYKPW